MAGVALGQDPATACEPQLHVQGRLDLQECSCRAHLELLRTQEVLSQRQSEQSSRTCPRDSACGL